MAPASSIIFWRLNPGCGPNFFKATIYPYIGLTVFIGEEQSLWLC
jgi:hypothetical protein